MSPRTTRLALAAAVVVGVVVRVALLGAKPFWRDEAWVVLLLGDPGSAVAGGRPVPLGFLWATAWCPTFPQGLVAAVFKIIDFDEKTWFLALYLPEVWQWPTIIAMIALGLTMHVMAVRIPIAHNRERWMAEATPTRPICL